MSVEVETKLVLDDQATAALARVKGGLEDVDKRIQGATSQFAAFGKQAIATAVGFQLSGIVDTLKSMGMEAFHAAVGNEDQIKALGGLLAMTDKLGASWEDTKRSAAELKDELEGISIAAGQSSDAVIGAFEIVAERSERSKEAVVELTQKFAFAGRAVKGGVEGLASAFAQLETGIIRPRSQLIMLMKQTGVVEGSAKEIAKNLNAALQSGDEAKKAKVYELAEQAVTRMAAKMRDVPLSYSEIVKTLKTLRENIFESLGGPIVKALTPALTTLRDSLLKNKESIEAFAQTVGTKVGDWIKSAAGKIEEGFKYLQNHADEIADAIKRGVDYAKAVVQFILEHKEEIAAAYGAKVGLGVASGIGQGASALAAGGKAAMGFGASIYGGAEVASMGAGAAAAASLYGLAAFTAAIVAVGAAAYHASKLAEEWPTDAKEAAAKLEAIQRTAYSGNIDEARKWADEIDKLNPKMSDAATKALQLTAAWAEYSDRVEQMARGGDRGQQQLVAEFEKMQAMGNTVQMRHIAQLIANGTLTADALDELTGTFKDGGAALADSIKEFNSKLGEELKKRVKAQVEVTGTKPPPFNFNIGNVTINQDFRDADPDRVAIILREDLAKAAVHRTAGMIQGAFGG